MKKPFTKTPEDQVRMEAYYDNRGVKEDPASRLKHFQTTYPSTYIEVDPPFENDEEKLGAWEYFILHMIE